MEETSNNTEAKGMGTGVIIAAVLAIALAIGGYFYFANTGVTNTGNGDGADANTTADIVLGTDRGTGPVARVNGTDIPRKAYEDNVVNVAETAQAQGIDITDATVQAQLKDQVLTTLINTELLVQAATKSGITIADAEVENQMDTLAAQFGGEEALQAQLVAYNLTEAELREDLRTQLLIEAYISSQVDMNAIVVTDAQIQAFYDSLDAGEAELPDLASIRPQIEEQLRSQQQQALVTELIESLRAEATIETLV